LRDTRDPLGDEASVARSHGQHLHLIAHLWFADEARLPLDLDGEPTDLPDSRRDVIHDAGEGEGLSRASRLDHLDGLGAPSLL
jgi:hypothetical protein